MCEEMRQPALRYLWFNGSFASRDPDCKKIRRVRRYILTKNESLAVLANEIAGQLGLAILGISLLTAYSQPVFAENGSPNKGLDQCSMAIVTSQKIDAGKICDPKMVRSLAQHGHVFEQNQLGMVSMLAIGSGYDPSEALKWFEHAARNGYAPAQVNLAVMYLNGWGTPINYGAALQWLHEAANQGYPRAYYNLGIVYQQGQGVRKDQAEALRYFRKGAEAGDSGAQTNLGYMYDNGIGVTRDLQAAVTWYRKAADSGNALAQNNLADLFLRGEGIAQDDAAAFRLFQQAAAQGQTGARIKLGYMYSSGRGTPKDLLTAYSWVTAAATAGDDRGSDLLRSLESKLSSGQVAQAKENAKKLSEEAGAQLSARVLQP
jgi:TPR repeat protein